MHADLGVTPPTDTDGVLQDVHWFGGLIGGAFQGYTLGNVMSAQFYKAAVSAQPEIPAEIARGHFATLLGWLTQNVYRHGRMLDPAALVERATGRPLSIDPYIAYLRAKYGELYELPGSARIRRWRIRLSDPQPQKTEAPLRLRSGASRRACGHF